MKNNITAGNRDYFSRGLVVDDDGQRIPISQSRFPTGVVFLIGLGLLVEGNDYQNSINLLCFCVSDI
ncbi:MAG: hypothetical protein QGI86_08210 [Candidatus Poribacteria bacterium]|nr:hypothetical protein [Candidatus Poribacteria bacterium]MDP6745793.1 hypothetical protein [Candidatus Poribacteria bacterium]MDP6995099.1 hypothetical protein [Candidatus Poribacteria bacterium]